MSQILLILVELLLLAAAQLVGGPPWTMLAAIALVLQARMGLTPGGLGRLAIAFGWLGLFWTTGNRELYFCFAMTLAADAILLVGNEPTGQPGTWRGALRGATAGSLLAAVFLGFRIVQQATTKVLAVELAVAVAILVSCTLAQLLLTRQVGPTPLPPPRRLHAIGEASIVIAAGFAAYAGLSL
ncbi:MAG: hypothetical protein ACO3NZ_02355 [Pirellulales bacterium]